MGDREAALLDLNNIRERRHDELGHTIWYLQSVPSTNDLIKRFVQRGVASDGLVVVADEQTSGRGRIGRTWHAEPGTAILASVYLEFLDVQIGYAVCALAVRNAIQDVTGMRVSIKWPNDLMVGGKKVCGILIDQLSHGAVAGMGINSNAEQASLDRIGPEATSLSVASGRVIDGSRLLDRLLTTLQDEYSRSLNRPDLVFREWRDSLVTLGHMVEVETASEKWSGRAVDVAEDGSLLVRSNQRIVRVYAADVRLRTR